jgi:hypothetical protein
MAGVRKRDRLLAGASAVLVAVLVNVFFAAPVAATVVAAGYWAYAIFLVVNSAIVAFVLGVLLPSEYGDWTKKLPTWVRDRLACIRKVVTVDEAKIEAGLFGRPWKWAKSKGAFWAILAISLITTTPGAGAVVARTLKLPERQAWVYSMISSAVFTAISISMYLGVLKAIWTWIKTML